MSLLLWSFGRFLFVNCLLACRTHGLTALAALTSPLVLARKPAGRTTGSRLSSQGSLSLPWPWADLNKPHCRRE